MQRNKYLYIHMITVIIKEITEIKIKCRYLMRFI